jgi:ABC-2 type transport system ATP-binding protein
MTFYLAAQHVQKRYGDTFAVADASLELRQGEILALLGPNGAGKTTLIKILATLLVKDAGRVEILGYDLDRHAEAIRHLFGYVGQDTERSAYARLTAAENLRFFWQAARLEPATGFTAYRAIGGGL